MTKTRVYDLAKQYGMTGQDLAAKLRDLGFSQIKSHMTALSDFELIEIQGRLEAYGIVGESRPEDESKNVGGLVIKRRKKTEKAEKVEAPEEPETTEEPEEAEPEVHGTDEGVEAPAATRVEEPVAPPPPAAAAAPAPAAVAPPAEEPVRAPAPPPAAERPAPVEAEAEAEPEDAVPAVAEAETAEVPQGEAAPAEGAGEADPEGAEEDGDIVRPSARRRPGKVVGFIDLSKIQPQQEQKRTQSRRLASGDEEVIDVQPTLGRDRTRAFQRGDGGQRGALTAAQLRERESSRFLRRKTPGGGGPGRGQGRQAGRPQRSPQAQGSPHSGGSVEIDEPITIKKLADALAVKQNDVMQLAFRELGFGAVNINSVIDGDTAALFAHEFDVELDVVKQVEAEERLLTSLQKRRDDVGAENLFSRPPVVCFLGHVDHGKTTLIDTIRRTKITEGEAGGITQHIGAYQVTTERGHTLTIVDTPGHAAFTAMRARGAKAVDIAVLVVAADDGVMPQTEEALQHVRVAGTPIVVALNKVDKPEANPDRVKTQLANLGLQPEEWGGDVAVMSVSGLKGTGVEELLERVFLESEVLELKCHPDGPASGVVLEAEIQKGKGKVAHLLVQDGSLGRGDVILAGPGYGKVRSITNDRGQNLEHAGPSMPIEVTGLNELPNVGEHFHVVDSLDEAKVVAQERGLKTRLAGMIERREVTTSNLLEAVAEDSVDVINVVVRADVQGSVEVLRQQITDLTHDEVTVKVILAGVGEVVESDVDLAGTSGATVLAFHVGVNSKARQAADRLRVEIRSFNVIYELLEYLKRLMEATLSPEINEEVTGHAEIRRVFRSSRFGNIAGCFILDGSVFRDSRIRLLRDGIVVHTGTVAGLRREKDDAREVREGYECGILLRDYNDINEGDVIEAYKVVESRRLLEI